MATTIKFSCQALCSRVDLKPQQIKLNYIVLSTMHEIIQISHLMLYYLRINAIISKLLQALETQLSVEHQFKRTTSTMIARVFRFCCAFSDANATDEPISASVSDRLTCGSSAWYSPMDVKVPSITIRVQKPVFHSSNISGRLRANRA